MSGTARKLFSLGAFVFVGTALSSAPTSSFARLWGIQRATNRIVVVDPVTGNVLSGFAPPGGALVPTQQFGGLTIAERGSVLLYQNPVANPTSLFRINPNTGPLISTEFMPAASSDPQFRAGLSYQTGAGALGQNAVFAINDGGPVQRQDGHGNPLLVDQTPGATFAGALGGDDTGRLFLAVSNPGGSIVEFNPFVPNSIIAGHPVPTGIGTVGGLAFDGVSLYLSDLNSRLYTLNPGAVIRSVLVQNGPLIGLGAYLPEPATTSSIAFAAWLLAAAVRQRHNRLRA